MPKVEGILMADRVLVLLTSAEVYWRYMNVLVGYKFGKKAYWLTYACV